MSDQDRGEDPFEAFRKQKEKEESGSSEEDRAEDEDGDETDEEADENLMDFLKASSEQEGRPEGFWSHRIEHDLDEDEELEVRESMPGGYSTHELSGVEEEEDNPEEVGRPDGFESHRWDQEETDQEDEEDEEENTS